MVTNAVGILFTQHERVTGSDGAEKWRFTCQHGSSECYGNKAQACGINEILTNNDRNEKQQDLANFVGCVMSARNPSQAVPQVKPFYTRSIS